MPKRKRREGIIGKRKASRREKKHLGEGKEFPLRVGISRLLRHEANVAEAIFYLLAPRGKSRRICVVKQRTTLLNPFHYN